MHLSSYFCAICNINAEESIMHLLFECPFSQSCWWNLIGVSWNLVLPPLDMIIEARMKFGAAIFREVVISAGWCIWISRIGVLFDNKPCNITSWKIHFKEEIGLICIKAKPSRAGSLKLSLENIT